MQFLINYPLATILTSLLGGVIPALLWLWFWRKEDRLHPEPRTRISLAFLAGMAAVFLVLPVEKLIFSINFSEISFLTILLWATVEELFKYGASYFAALKDSVVDEPIDPIIYLITAALGFSALENALFLSNLIDLRLFFDSIVTGNSRFIGATLLHVVSSAAIGVMMGLSFYKQAWLKRIFLFTGILISITLHTIFNLLIIKFESNTFLVFSGVWTLVIVLIVLLEKIKRVAAR